MSKSGVLAPFSLPLVYSKPRLGVKGQKDGLTSFCHCRSHPRGKGSFLLAVQDSSHLFYKPQKDANRFCTCREGLFLSQEVLRGGLRPDLMSLVLMDMRKNQARAYCTSWVSPSVGCHPAGSCPAFGLIKPADPSWEVHKTIYNPTEAGCRGSFTFWDFGRCLFCFVCVEEV